MSNNPGEETQFFQGFKKPGGRLIPEIFRSLATDQEPTTSTNLLARM